MALSEKDQTQNVQFVQELNEEADENQQYDNGVNYLHHDGKM